MTMAPNFTFFENIFTKSVQDKKDVACCHRTNQALLVVKGPIALLYFDERKAP